MGMIKRLMITTLLFAAVCLMGCSSETVSTDQTQKGFGKAIIRINIANYGNVDVRLFPEDSSECYDAFMDNVRNGIYNGSSVSRIIDDYCIVVSGASDKTGNSQSDMTGEESELSEEVPYTGIYPLYGSLCISNDATDSGSSEFMIIGTDSAFINELDEMVCYKGVTLKEYILNAYGVEISDEEIQMFKEKGGAPWLYKKCKVIGQVFNGLDVIDELSKVTVSADVSYSPLEDIIVDSIELVEE